MKNKLKYFFENHFHNIVYVTSDETLFINQEDAEKHARTLKDNVVEEYSRTSVKEVPVIPAPNAEQTGESALQNATKKPSPNELKAIKAVADYLALFGEAPNPKLSVAQIQELIKAKQLELNTENQGEGETGDAENSEGEEQPEGKQSQEDNQEENQSE